VESSTRTPGASGVDSVSLELDQNEQVRIEADRRNGAVISQPFRPDATAPLPERPLGDLLSEELRRLDDDEPYSDALEAATGVTGLAQRSPVRKHIWFDPAEADHAGGNGGHGSPAEPADDTSGDKGGDKKEDKASGESKPRRRSSAKASGSR